MTEAEGRAIQHSQESLRVLSKRYGISQKTLANWKKRTAVKHLPTGPKEAHSTVLRIDEEAIIVAFGRCHAVLLAGAEDETDRQAEGIDYGLDLGAETASGSPESLGLSGPPEQTPLAAPTDRP